MPRDVKSCRLLHPSNASDSYLSVAGAVRDGADVVVRLRGEYDSTTTPALARILDSALASGEKDLVVDLAAVTFMDATAARLLTKTAVVLAARRVLALRAPSESSQMVLDLFATGGLVGLATFELPRVPSSVDPVADGSRRRTSSFIAVRSRPAARRRGASGASERPGVRPLLLESP